MNSSASELFRYLEDGLDWPLEERGFDELTFGYDADELGLKDEDAAKIRNPIRRLRPLHHDQPWGIFFIEFERKKLPVVVLRRILGHLVIKKRASAPSTDRAAWNSGDLLFVTAIGETGIAFAHFHRDANTGSVPVLRVLGGDGTDVPPRLDQVSRALHERLRWPVDECDHAAWRERWGAAFEHRPGRVIRTTKELAAALADLAGGIRSNALAIMTRETERGPLRRELAAFKSALVHDLSEETFADMYAQTITYGLFTAANSGDPGAPVHAADLPEMVPDTNPFLREVLARFLVLGGHKGVFDFDELGIQEVVRLLNDPTTDLPAVRHDFNKLSRGQDPVMYFYESFLTAYNKALKFRHGVFYTPQPVVSYIVRSVHELLQTGFGLADGLADTATWGEMLQKHPGLTLPPLTDEPGETRTISPDEPFVQILDPATGTATFLIEIIDVIHRTLAAKWQRQRLTDAEQRAAWNEYVPRHLLPRLHAFELMAAPYAVAHMKIGLKLAETGYRFGSDERARIYLTNALEPWAKKLPLTGFDALAREAEAVNEIKRRKRFTVIVGNPPYSYMSANPGGTSRALIEPFRFIDGKRVVERGALVFERALQDDYVKFFALAFRLIEAAGADA